MKEIEVKASVKNLDTITNKLKTLGCAFTAPVEQKDIIFLKQGIAYDQIKPGVIVLRIRQENEKTLFTLKMRGPIELNKIEHEVSVSDATEAAAIVKNLGFEEVLRVNKVRQKSRLHNYNICIDAVEGLGTFIEVESLSESGDETTVSSQLSDFLLGLGIMPEDHVHQGYDTLLFNKNKK